MLPTAGKVRRSCCSSEGASTRSASGQLMMASMAVWRLQRLGPRRARMRDTCMQQVSCRSESEGGGVLAVALDAGADQLGRRVQRPGGSGGHQDVAGAELARVLEQLGHGGAVGREHFGFL